MFKLAYATDSDEMSSFKFPVITGIVMIYIATVFAQNTAAISLQSTVWFTIAMGTYLLVYLFSDKIFKQRHWIYFLIQGIIIFDCAVIMPKGYETIFLGIIPIMVVQSMIVYYEVWKVVVASIYFYGIFISTILIFEGIDVLIHYVPILLIITFAVRIYSSIFLRQVKMRVRTQKLLKELELAYETVEELTLTNERQRMARDLHDTLSQGLAGTIMQLDAINANLDKNNTKRAQEIVNKAMEHARNTLAESRLVIDDLRLQTEIDKDFIKKVEDEITRFKTISNITIKNNIKIHSEIPLKISKHVLYIVRESLNNIIKHSKAKNAVLKIQEEDDETNIEVCDDGIGFNIKLLNQLFGHYGVLGMTERVKAIHGNIKIHSKRKSGTKINITIPIEKGNGDEYV